MYSSFHGDITKNSSFEGTALRCDGFGDGKCDAATFPDGQTNDFGRTDGCKLELGLGPTPSAYSDKYFRSMGNKANGLLSQCDSMLQLGLSGDSGSVSNTLEFTVSMQSHSDVCRQVPSDGNGLVIPVVDEGSTSAKKSGGYMRSLILAPQIEKVNILPETYKLPDYCPSTVSNYSLSTVSEPGNKTRNTKRCVFDGCTKGARGATGMCISHGGGPRCQKPGCSKGAESHTAYCKAHGGGKRCQHLGCTKSAEGRTDLCIAHGGGRRCEHSGGCTKAARGRSGFCIRHGGGKRCMVLNCTRSAEGYLGLCISHGGGRRCQFPDGCTKGAQGSTYFCKAHGGGRRCVFSGCTRGAEGRTPLCKGHGGGRRCSFGDSGGGMCPKSVHGGTEYCVAHGGGKRCSVPGCTKSARGRTDCCVKHGGGKRCRFESCGKSAQGSTDFCKAHGGGKRCDWGDDMKCEKFARGKTGLCAAHCTMVYGRETKRVGTIRPGLFRGLDAPPGKDSFDNTCSSSGVSTVSDSVKSLEKPTERRHQLIPPQVLVPLSMKGPPPSDLRPLGSEKQRETSAGVVDNSGKGFVLVVPEGRVHGGRLLSLLGGDLNNAVDRI